MGVVKDDVLIAEFMELAMLHKTEEGHWIYNNAILEDWEPIPSYGSSWEELMSVLEKIENLKRPDSDKGHIICDSIMEFDSVAKENNKDCYSFRLVPAYKDYDFGIINYTGNNRKEIIYNAIMEFIKWYLLTVKK